MYERSLLQHSLFRIGTRVAILTIAMLFLLSVPIGTAVISGEVRVGVALFLFAISNLGTFAARSVINMHQMGAGSSYGRRCASCGLPLVLEKAPRSVGLKAPTPWPDVSMLACVESKLSYGHTRQLVRVRH